MRTYGTNDGEQLTAAQLVDREVRMPDLDNPGSWAWTGIIVGETHGGRLVVRQDGGHRTHELHATHNIVIFGKRDDRVIAMLEQQSFEREDFLRDLANERGELQAAAADAHRAADELRRAARSANEAAGWIAGEASRIRRA